MADKFLNKHFEGKLEPVVDGDTISKMQEGHSR